ncbi:response regulator receiver domain [Amphritea sp.]|uniref:response regulator receiver domain n=1 Tax=Amphritea sp. TaxID=1872502 RepID=UPI003A95B70E
MANGTGFADLVHEAFIKPLRSVLIVDDQYPTWEEIFNSKLEGVDKSDEIEIQSTRKSWYQSATAKEVSSLVREFRRQNPGFIIDIHDGVFSNNENKTAGSETPQELADHLHQSDLLILDYNLEGTEVGTGGNAARRILSSVLSNQHFNLVVIHTSENLDNVFHECVMSLMQTCSSGFDKKCWDSIDKLKGVIEEAEDADEFRRADLIHKMDLASYLKLRTPDGSVKEAIVGEFMRGRGELSELHRWAGSLGLNPAQERTFLFWAVSEFEVIKAELFFGESFAGLGWENKSSCKWLRTSRGFVCFVKKGPETLITELKNALVDWKPTPSRLLSAKYRDEISRMGADVEDKSLSQKHAFAKFYDTILKPSELKLEDTQIDILRRQKLREHVSRQSEMLSFLIEEEIVDFGSRIFEADRLSEFQFKNHYDVNLDESDEGAKAVSQYNKHVCCLPSKLPVDGKTVNEQLDSGHVFKLGDGWWVCATPACDLQPGQNTIAFSKGRDSTLRPFTALKLEKVSNLAQLTSNHINSGSYCYIEYEGSVIGLGIRSPKMDVEKPAEPKVFWRSMIAKNGGVITDGKLELLEIQLELENDSLKSELKKAEVVAKLRYEYALNFIQRVGGSVSRIGLGYVT